MSGAARSSSAVRAAPRRSSPSPRCTGCVAGATAAWKTSARAAGVSAARKTRRVYLIRDELRMPELTSPDNHHLNAATGWLELGNHLEAKAELGKISSANRRQPAVLEVDWRILAAEKNWPGALAVARELVQADPDNASGWIHQSYTLHEMKQTREAFDLLLTVFERFPGLS